MVKCTGRTINTTQDTLEACDAECLVPEDTVMVGEIVGILKRENLSFTGSVLTESPVCPFPEKDKFVLFSPASRKFPNVWVHSLRHDELKGKRIIVVIDSWPEWSSFPIGHCTQVLGNAGDPKVETQILLSEFGVTSEEFSTEVMACLPPKDWVISEAELRGRTDFRAVPIVSIDPPGCKDIDDALHCILLPNGRYQVGVHIAGIC